ncbi:hypothetical protein UPYG_G00065160 [Umbra pygmaea]|uniref:WW domain binding protein 1-like b n=1 Tax=Umbra pygmaea TaxID=75934 RepID=A0ABD0XXM6_UMBPY
MNEILFSVLTMGLFLDVVAVSPPDTASDESLVSCEGANNQSYVCESGHCCGESQCCSYYYELWWFWLVWAVILLLSCCCVCHHRRTKHRLQQQQRQHEINLMAYREAHNYSSMPFYFRFLPNYLLPDYEEVVNRPSTPPPPYSASGLSSVASPLTSDPQDGPTVQNTSIPPVSDGLCSRPCLEEPQHIGTPAIGLTRHKADQKGEETLDGDPESWSQEACTEGPTSLEKGCKEPLLFRDIGPDVECATQEDKDKGALGRRRRFTGDSGIEVCVCGLGGSTGSQDGKEPREMESLLGEEEEDEGEGGFCDGCAHRTPNDEQDLALEDLDGRATAPHSPPSAALTPPPVCLLLHTVNEQEGTAHPSTEPQG